MGEWRHFEATLTAAPDDRAVAAVSQVSSCIAVPVLGRIRGGT